MGLSSNIDSKFERCQFFLIIDIEKNLLFPIKNMTKNRHHEIGNTVGQIIVKEGIDTVITSDIGPSAFEIFKRYKIMIYQAKGNIENAIRNLKEGNLSEITKPTVPKYLDWKKIKNTE